MMPVPCPMALPRSHGRLLHLVVTAGALSGVLCCRVLFAADDTRADSSKSAGEKLTVVQADDADDALQPVAYRMAASGEFDSSAPTVPAPAAKPGPDRVWRIARPKIPRRSSSPSTSLGLASVSNALDNAGHAGVFSLSRSVTPLLAPPSVTAFSRPVADVDAATGASMGVTEPAKSASSLRFR